MTQPVPQPIPSAHARATAATLRAGYGVSALSGAKVALEVATRRGDPVAIELWSEICALLAAETITISI